MERDLVGLLTRRIFMSFIVDDTCTYIPLFLLALALWEDGNRLVGVVYPEVSASVRLGLARQS